MHRLIAAIANPFVQHLSALLTFFGLALLLIGASVRVSREQQLQQAQARSVPSQAELLELEPLPTASVVTRLGSTAAPPDRLVIPAIDLDTPVVEVGWEARIVNDERAGNVWKTASYAAGFHRGSAPPGQPGNTVLSGHNNIEGAVFKDLHLLDSGDRIYLYAGGRRYTYEVRANFILQEEGADLEQRRRNAEWIGPTSDERLTLVTCFPPWSNTHRTVIIARPVVEHASSVHPELPFR